MFFLKPDGGGLTVPRIYLYLIGQYKQLLPDTVQQRFVMAARQVCTANALVKQHIAPDHKLLCRVIK